MELITWLTLGYAAILVLALAVVLIAILFYLRQILAALGDVRLALEQVRDATAGMSEYLAPVPDTCAEALGHFTAASASVDGAADHVDRIAERLGIRREARRRGGVLWKVRSMLSGG